MLSPPVLSMPRNLISIPGKMFAVVGRYRLCYSEATEKQDTRVGADAATVQHSALRPADVSF